MSKKVLLFVWLSVVFVTLGFILFSCGPKKPAPKPEGEGLKETAVVSEQATTEEKEFVTTKRETAKAKEGVLLVADFDTGSKPNSVGGDFGSWNKDAQDFSQGCFDSFIPTIKHGDTGYSLQLMYDVASENAAYNGFWMKLNGINISDYKELSFWVKGDAERGFTRVFKVELKNTKNNVGTYYVTDVSPEWKEVVIPLNKFSGINDLSSMYEFTIVFEDRIATKREGAIYIDDIAFVK